MALWAWTRGLRMTQTTTLTWTHSLSATPGSYITRVYLRTNVIVATGVTPHILDEQTNHVLIGITTGGPAVVDVEAQVIPSSSIVAS